MLIKKGQTTLFVIITILIVTLFLLIFYFTSTRKSSHDHFEKQVNNIKAYGESCIQHTINKVIFETGKRAGYYELPNLSIRNIPCYFYENNNLMPTIDFLEKELEKGFKNEGTKCFKNISTIQEDISINFSEPRVKVKIEEETTIFDVDFLITLRKEEKTTIINYSRTQILNLKLGKIHNFAADIVSECVKEDSISFTKFLDSFLSEGLLLNITIYEGIAIFNITDPNFKIGNETYFFLFSGIF